MDIHAWVATSVIDKTYRRIWRNQLALDSSYNVSADSCIRLKSWTLYHLLANGSEKHVHEELITKGLRHKHFKGGCHLCVGLLDLALSQIRLECFNLVLEKIDERELHRGACWIESEELAVQADLDINLVDKLIGNICLGIDVQKLIWVVRYLLALRDNSGSWKVGEVSFHLNFKFPVYLFLREVIVLRVYLGINVEDWVSHKHIAEDELSVLSLILSSVNNRDLSFKVCSE